MIPLVVERTFTRFEPSPSGLVLVESWREVNGVRTTMDFQGMPQKNPVATMLAKVRDRPVSNLAQWLD